MNEKHPLDGLLEPGASKYDPIVSIAISLKRLADAATMADGYGLTGSASIAQAIVDGLRHKP